MKRLVSKALYAAPAIEIEQVSIEGGFALSGLGGGASTEDVGDLEEFGN
ncbi:MAG: hypothetical protein J6R13_03255 [Alistipes sp.]|nr:hypothetical protein [Alistipes sp.]